MRDFAAHMSCTRCVCLQNKPVTDLTTLDSCKQCFICLFSGNCRFAHSSWSWHSTKKLPGVVLVKCQKTALGVAAGSFAGGCNWCSSTAEHSVQMYIKAAALLSQDQTISVLSSCQCGGTLAEESTACLRLSARVPSSYSSGSPRPANPS